MPCGTFQRASIAGAASRSATAALRVLVTAGAAASLLTACGTGTPHPTTPGEHVVIQKVFIDVPRPCPVKKPVRPAKLKRPLPVDPAALAELLMAKLLEWSGPGGFGDQASDAIDTCIKP